MKDSERSKLLSILLEAEGMDELEFMEEYLCDSIVPGICKNCHSIYDYEPDQEEGWCDECDSGTVVSGAVLLQVI